MTVSLDGYVNDRDGGVDALYADFDELRDAASFQRMIEDTGAVVMGRRTFDMAPPGTWDEGYEFQTPIFVLTHTPPPDPPPGNDRLRFTFVTHGVESAVSQAKQAAGERDVQVIGGPDTIQQALAAGLCDELHVDVMPVLLGAGLTLFDGLDGTGLVLQRLDAEETTSARTSLKFAISRPGTPP